eukprot:2949163-Pleurochrysis_carterae.AAC.1
MHDPIPRLSGDATEERHRGHGERLEVGVAVDVVAEGDVPKQLDAEHRVDEEEEQQERHDVEE